MAQQVPHMLRTDARDNRDRVLEAARGLFAERGIADVTMREIARRAEVGPATLYRRFPAKQLLVEAAFELEMQACRAIVENGCAAEDPWAGFCSIIQDFSVLNAHNHGFTEAFMVIGGASDGLVAHRTSLLESLSQVAGRAVRAGSLRRDFVIDDLVLVLLAGRGLASTAPELREAAARRFAGLAIDAFRADSGHRRLPPAPRLLPGLT